MLRELLVIGDSNAAGYSPSHESSLLEDSLIWPNLVADELNIACVNSSVGGRRLSGRAVGGFDVPDGLEAADSVDVGKGVLAIVALGTNDGLTWNESVCKLETHVISGLGAIAKALHERPGSIIGVGALVPPGLTGTAYEGQLEEDAMRHIRSAMGNLSEELGVQLFCGIDVASCTDGVHMTAEDHSRTAELVLRQIRL